MYNPDNIVVKASATNFAGNAQFVLRVDGVQVGSAHDISANHALGESQNFSFATNISGAQQLSIEFVNDFYVPYGPSTAFDRNMFVDGLTINGQSFPGSSLIPSSTAHTSVTGSSTTLEAGGPVRFNINGYKGVDTIDKMAFGFVEHSPLNPAGQVYAVYDALLGRAPDPLGLEGWTLALNNGASLRGVAQAIIGSAEGQANVGALDNGAFVEQLYQSTLHRHSDQAGFATWTAQLNTGTSRGDVALSFALSPEHITNLSSTYDAGFFVPDATAASVARLYYAVLDRAPDAAGLQGFEAQVKQATANGAIQALGNVANGMLTSSEYASTHAGQTNAGFVDSLYVGALGRHADAGGAAFFADQIAHGISKAAVALEISQSAEAQVRLVGQIENGFHLIG